MNAERRKAAEGGTSSLASKLLTSAREKVTRLDGAANAALPSLALPCAMAISTLMECLWDEEGKCRHEAMRCAVS